MQQFTVALVTIVSTISLTGSVTAQSVQACVNNKSGVLRVVDNPGECRRAESPLSWGSDGQQGVPADELSKRQWVGCTDETDDGVFGVANVNAMCAAKFGDGARMCDTTEILESPFPPNPGDNLTRCWVRPDFQPLAVSNGKDEDAEVFVLDASGRSNKSIIGDFVSSGQLSCNGWSTNDEGARGLIAFSNGRFTGWGCNIKANFSCCAPPASQ